ncbi:MAG: EAL domain-containing protein [Pseudonocardiaceae bacterium]|nr:EAL domain-containing protein [Pseudonocardiaceae bacterium]
MGTSYVSMTRAEIEDLLAGFVVRLRAALRAESFDADVVRDIAAEMVSAHFTGTETLRRTIEVLAVMDGKPERLAALQGAFAAGYAAALQERGQLEQESILRAMVAAWQQAERGKRDSDARFAAVFTQAGMGIGVGDLQGNILDANAALLDMLGYTRRDLCQRTVGEFIHPDDALSVWPLYKQLVRGERDHFRVEKRFFRSDGGVVWTQLAVSLVRDEAGAPKFQVAMMEDVTDRQQLQLQLRHQATHDPLTQLPNRALFQERLAAVFDRDCTRVGLCYLDLDGFKVINDSLGHDVGDQLLVTVAQRLQACVAPRLAARIGGDEFVILVEDCSGTDEVIALAEAVLAALAEPVHVGGHALAVSASIGIVDRPVDTMTVADAMQAADITLYWAKADGKGRWARYDEDRNAQELTRLRLSATMPAALERGEFFVDYQPLVGLASGAVVGAEALVRWAHPTMGRLGPDRFIGLAEETGQIVELGRWVLRQACLQVRRWPTGFVSVNLAERQCREPKLVTDVAEILTETGTAPNRLQLELTESAMMGTTDETLRTVRELAEMGVRIAIDDFGTGYSNLSYLRSLPVHELKIAGSFMAGLRCPRDKVDECIVETLVTLAHTLGLTVTGEGVESALQARRLHGIGCDHAQGWFFAPPGTPEAIIEMLASHAILS